MNKKQKQTSRSLVQLLQTVLHFSIYQSQIVSFVNKRRLLLGLLLVATVILSSALILGSILTPNASAQNLADPSSLLNNSQSNSNTSENQSLTQLELLDSLAQEARIGQLNEKELRDLIKSIKSENVQLEQEILTLSSRKVELQSTLEQLNQLRDGQDNPDSSIPVIQNLAAEIRSAEDELITVETELAKKTSKEEANKFTIQLAEGRLNQLTSSVQQDVSTLQAQIFEVFSRYSFYFGLILIYFALLQLLNLIGDRFITSDIVRDVFKFVITLIIIVATIITLLVAFVGNLTYLLTGLGVVSAALVVALQDFVSSMFAFFWIKLRGIYKNQDVIDINTGSTGIVTGVVVNVGLFRTTLKELYGEGELNAERSSGRTVSIPNNIILKAPVVNYTQDNRILWHVISVTVTFESDFDLAKELLAKIAEKQFKYALDHKDQMLDDAYNLEYIYAPKIFMEISSIGPQFDVWFAARYGKFREVKEELSQGILHSFKMHGIDLAYNTTRVIATPKNTDDQTSIAFKDTGFIDR